MYLYTRIYMYMQVDIYLHIYIYIYIFICIHISLYIYICIYAYVHNRYMIVQKMTAGTILFIVGQSSAVASSTKYTQNMYTCIHSHIISLYTNIYTHINICIRKLRRHSARASKWVIFWRDCVFSHVRTGLQGRGPGGTPPGRFRSGNVT